MILIRHHGELKVLGRNQAMRMLLEQPSARTASLFDQLQTWYDDLHISQMRQQVSTERKRQLRVFGKMHL